MIKYMRKVESINETIYKTSNTNEIRNE